MQVTITNDDLKYIKKFKNKNIPIEYSTILIYMFLYVSITTIMFYVVLSINGIYILNHLNDFVFPIIATIFICILIFFIEKHVEKKLSIYKNYTYLLNTFKIIINDEKKSIMLKSFNVKIDLLIKFENIQIFDEIIFLLEENEVIGIIPLFKIEDNDKDNLVKTINQYLGGL